MPLPLLLMPLAVSATKTAIIFGITFGSALVSTGGLLAVFWKFFKPIINLSNPRKISLARQNNMLKARMDINNKKIITINENVGSLSYEVKMGFLSMTRSSRQLYQSTNIIRNTGKNLEKVIQKANNASDILAVVPGELQKFSDKHKQDAEEILSDLNTLSEKIVAKEKELMPMLNDMKDIIDKLDAQEKIVVLNKTVETLMLENDRQKKIIAKLAASSKNLYSQCQFFKHKLEEGTFNNPRILGNKILLDERLIHIDRRLPGPK